MTKAEKKAAKAALAIAAQAIIATVETTVDASVVDNTSLDFTASDTSSAVIETSAVVIDVAAQAQACFDAVKSALVARNSAQYSRDNDLSIKLLSVAQMRVLIDAQIDAAKFAATVAQHDKSKTDFIAVKAFYKVLQVLDAIARKSISHADDYTAIILHNARKLSNEISYDLAAYSLCKSITFDEEKLEQLSSVKLARKNVKASTMSTQRSSSKNALAMLNAITYSDKKITLNADSVILQNMLALDE